MSENKGKSNFFRDCKKATIEPVEGKVISGTIPTWLEGMLIRNGAGIQSVGSTKFKHYFDGLAVLHRFHIKNGKVTYNSRPLESDAYTDNMAAGKIVANAYGTLGEPDPCDSLFSKFKTMFLGGEKKPTRDTATDNCNVNVGFFGDQLYAMTETVYNRRFDSTTLETLGGKTPLDKYLPINMASAHPHILEDGTAITMGTNCRHSKGPHYLVVKVPPTFNSEDPVFSKAEILAEIPARWKLFPSYSHSFSMAGDKVVFVEQPFCFNVPRFFWSKVRSAVFSSCFQWWPNQTTRIHIVSVLDGSRNEFIYETKDLFMFHQVNAYEEDGHVIMDVSGYNSGDLVTCGLGADTMKTNGDFQNSLRRYVLPLEIPAILTPAQNLVTMRSQATATLRPGTTNVIDLEPHILYPLYFEFPRINYNYNGKKYRYAYGVTSSKGPLEKVSFPEPNQVSKIDLETEEISSWSAGDEAFVSEPVFISKENARGEDDGLLLVSLLHLDDETKVSLIIIDAKTMKTVAQVQFQAQGAVTTTLHGQWAQAGTKIHKY